MTAADIAIAAAGGLLLFYLLYGYAREFRERPTYGAPNQKPIDVYALNERSFEVWMALFTHFLSREPSARHGNEPAQRAAGKAHEAFWSIHKDIESRSQ